MRDVAVSGRWLVLLMALFACDKPAGEARPAETKSAPAPVAATPGDPRCPATGRWAECSVLYRLERSGLAPHVDSTGSASEKSLTGRPLLIKFGTASRLEVFLYPDSAARKADAAKLDRAGLVGATQQQTLRRERTLIENANLIGLLSSINDRLRERVSDALTAGAPQPTAP
ncbi:MAG TPA: hypothetical protein VGP95_13620 [Gemmatimonadaceae bacterium]|jgi:hypothetical protein|nr:hypothetical protein [Gemmatimonadaceae bacterium]